MAMTRDEQRLWHYLATSCVGRARAQTVPIVAASLAMTSREVRRLRHAIVTERKLAIDSCQAGYFVPATEAEHQVVVRSLRHRAGELWQLIRQLEGAQVARPEQRTLFAV